MTGGPSEHVREPASGETHSELSGSAGDVVQAGTIHGGIFFGGQGRARGPVLQQLPVGVHGFVNRQVELDRLDTFLAGDVAGSSVAGVSVIVGTAGVGKTSLAVHWAHRVRPHFPDGQLYVNLRGYDPGPPIGADRVLDRFLRALDVPPRSIPVDVDDKAALYRSLLANRRMLVVLDNAATVGQVRPLLPGTAACLVVVTSRSRLSGLVIRDGAHRVTLDVLTAPDAVLLLRTATAAYRAEDDSAELVELARLCGRLPLALRIAAERAARRPRIPLDQLIMGLRDESGFWAALSSGEDEDAEAVRTAFAWSYRALAEQTARVFRLLGLYPGSEFSTAAAAVLVGVDVNETRRQLDILAGLHLMEENGADRYQFHDLLRIYATDQARQEETPESLQAALRRVLAWYLRSADAAQAALRPYEPRVPLDPPGEGSMPMTFGGFGEAMRWCESERVNFGAVIRAATAAGDPRFAWQFAVVLRTVYGVLTVFDDWLDTSQIGLDAARQLGDRGAEAELLESLAMVHIQARSLEQGAEYYRATLNIRRELGDGFGAALALNGLGRAALLAWDLVSARSFFEQSLAGLREHGDSYWEALLLFNLGHVSCELEELAEAHRVLRRALDIFRERGERINEGDTFYLLSRIERERGQPGTALPLIEQAIAIAREQSNRVQDAYWSLELGAVLRALGRPAEALVVYQQAATLHRQLGDRSREARVLDATGEAYAEIGRTEEAADFHRRAAATHRELKDRWQLAVSLNNLANVLLRTGADDRARLHWAEALSILAGFGDPRAADMRRRISERLGTT
ncbi:MAG TPA: tetratricopeptide repeat protein [Actinophytocola sp.]|uniref:ATP-binding protein n=1 Tax=Actinophytocola sp. TaxID=1872138 RepID=UPI002E06E9E5|nr:tetratricopeptide repeat protein [Actinophytocola sp.]